MATVTRLDNFRRNVNEALNDMFRSLYQVKLNDDSKISVQLHEIPSNTGNPDSPDVVAEAVVVTKMRYSGTSAKPTAVV